MQHQRPRRLRARFALLLVAGSVLVGFFELVAFASGDSDPEANRHVASASWIALGISFAAGLTAYLLTRAADRSRWRAACSAIATSVAVLLIPVLALLAVALVDSAL